VRSTLFSSTSREALGALGVAIANGCSSALFSSVANGCSILFKPVLFSVNLYPEPRRESLFGASPWQSDPLPSSLCHRRSCLAVSR
ncbi:hypothetical protein HN51_069053, partial [Arachis hypogaea]